MVSLLFLCSQGLSRELLLYFLGGGGASIGGGSIPELRRGSLMDRYLEALMHFEIFGPKNIF